MRQPADWMGPAHERMLEHLRDDGGRLRTQDVADALQVSPQYISGIGRELEAIGLVDKPARGLWEISPAGHAFLDEDLDLRDAEFPFPGDGDGDADSD